MNAPDRSPVMPAPSTDAKNRFTVGVDLGGTNLRIAAYTHGADLLEMMTMPARIADGPMQVVLDMASGIRRLAQTDFGGLHFAGVGIGMPGPL